MIKFENLNGKDYITYTSIFPLEFNMVYKVIFIDKHYWQFYNLNNQMEGELIKYKKR